MDIIHRDLPSRNFSVPGQVKQYGICSVSGDLATDYCGESARNEWFEVGKEPKVYCTVHSNPNWDGYYPEGI